VRSKQEGKGRRTIREQLEKRREGSTAVAGLHGKEWSVKGGEREGGARASIIWGEERRYHRPKAASARCSNHKENYGDSTEGRNPGGITKSKIRNLKQGH